MIKNYQSDTLLIADGKISDRSEIVFSRGANEASESLIKTIFKSISRFFSRAFRIFTTSFGIAIVAIISFLTSPFILSAWLWRQSQPANYKGQLKLLRPLEKESSRSDGADNINDANSCSYCIYAGGIVLPERIYEGDSQNVQISLKNSGYLNLSQAEADNLLEHEKYCFIVSSERIRGESSKDFLKIEFLAGGFNIDGEKKQQQNLSSQILSFRWSCYFPNSGNHDFTLTLKLLESTDSNSNDFPVWLGDIEHKVRVMKLGGLTKLQMSQLSVIISVIGIVVSISSLPSLIKILPQLAELLK